MDIVEKYAKLNDTILKTKHPDTGRGVCGPSEPTSKFGTALQPIVGSPAYLRPGPAMQVDLLRYRC